MEEPLEKVWMGPEVGRWGLGAKVLNQFDETQIWCLGVCAGWVAVKLNKGIVALANTSFWEEPVPSSFCLEDRQFFSSLFVSGTF